jgi:hypothetical protein
LYDRDTVSPPPRDGISRSVADSIKFPKFVATGSAAVPVPDVTIPAAGLHTHATSNGSGPQSFIPL